MQRTLAREGRIDLFCSNAGILTGVGLEDADDVWHRAFDVNVMAHVYAARAVLPAMLERGRGYLLNTASAAGLLTTPGDAPYTVTKHGAVGLAEWLAVTYGSRGIGVSVLCPLGVATPMLMDPLAAGESAARAVAASGEIVSPGPGGRRRSRRRWPRNGSSSCRTRRSGRSGRRRRPTRIVGCAACAG